MAPRTESPRLVAIDPDALARETVATLRAHVAAIALPLQPAYRVTIAPMLRPDGSPPPDDLETNLGQTVRQLAGFACTGDPGDWEPAEGDVAEAIAEALRAAGTPSPALSLVIDAARGRAMIAAGDAVEARELAALAGLSATQVRALSRSGDLPGELPLSAEEARAWLAARGVVT
ncbi:MAG: hypothetical protein EPO40_16650 [Myxococcaceae bacterium]|nr:MAG: hypothetical protein EPO40_16650 [Myxococcaceae bacterium]